MINELHHCWNDGEPHISVAGDQSELISCRGIGFVLSVVTDQSTLLPLQKLFESSPAGSLKASRALKQEVIKVELGLEEASLDRRLRYVATFSSGGSLSYV